MKSDLAEENNHSAIGSALDTIRFVVLSFSLIDENKRRTRVIAIASLSSFWYDLASRLS